MQETSLKTWAKGEKSPYQLHDITHFPYWGTLTILDAFFNNLAAAMMICTALLWYVNDTIMTGFLPVALTCTLIFLIIDLLILVADLACPNRFFHSLRVMRFTSPLSVGVWGLSCFGISLGIATVFSWIYFYAGGEADLCTYILSAIMRLGIVMALIAAVVVICYKGVVFSCSSQPGLCQARWLTPFMVSDSLLLGFCIVGVIAILCSPLPGINAAFILPAIVLLCARCITFALLWQDVKYRAKKVYDEATNRWAGIAVYIIGGAAPLILFFCGPIGFILASACIVCVSLYERKWLIELPKPV